MESSTARIGIPFILPELRKSLTRDSTLTKDANSDAEQVQHHHEVSIVSDDSERDHLEDAVSRQKSASDRSYLPSNHERGAQPCSQPIVMLEQPRRMQF